MIGAAASAPWKLAAAVLAVAACQTERQRTATTVPTLASEAFEQEVHAYRGQIVRVCGRLSRRSGHWAVERVPPAGEVHFHGPPAVLVMPCNEAPPQLDRDSCITGRIAAEDGSMNPPPRTWRDNRPVNFDWFLHPQCRRIG